jgi:tetratricopeptide (TPR) repeat protein
MAPDSLPGPGASKPHASIELRTRLTPLNYGLRYSVLRLALFALLISTTSAFAQKSDSGEKSQAATARQPAAEAQPISEEVSAAEADLAKSEWKAAQAKLETWVASHPADSRALFDLGYVADAQNRLDDAAGLYRRALEANPQSSLAHLSLGLLLARQEKFSDALPELEAVTSQDQGEADPELKARAWRALARIEQNTDLAQASKDLLEALKLTPETIDDTLLAASLAEQAGETASAETAYRRVLAKDPKSAPANAGLAHLLIASKQYPEAETLLRAALDQTPGDPALTAQLAAVLAAQDKGEALPLIQQLHDAHPNDRAISRMLAELLAESGDYAASDLVYVKLLAAAPDDSTLLIAHGQNLIRLLKYAEAFIAFERATQLDPANGDGWSGLAFAASRTNQPSITLHALTERSKLLPEVPSTYFLWATAYDNLHQKVAAATYYHHFLDSSAGKFPDQEWQARQRIKLLENKP